MTVHLPGTLTPVGFGVAPPTALSPPSPLLADQLDVDTRDFLDLSEGRDPIDDQVIIALRIRRNSGAAVMGIGNRFHLVRKMTSSAKTTIDSYAREALSRLIENGDILFLGTEFPYYDEGTQGAVSVFSYKNLRALDGDIRRVPVPIGD